MNWIELFDKLVIGIATELKLKFFKTNSGYLLSRENVFIGGISYIIGRNEKLRILTNPAPARFKGMPIESIPKVSIFLGRPIDLGEYTMEELQGRNSKARKAIIAKLIELSKK